MTHLFAVRRGRGPAWKPAAPLEDQPLWAEHAAFMDALHDEGVVVAAGPLEEVSAALVIMRAKDAAECARRLAEDPWGPDMLATAEIALWTVRIGNIC